MVQEKKGHGHGRDIKCKDTLEMQTDGTYLCPSGTFVNIGARFRPPKNALCELCQPCPKMVVTKGTSSDPTQWKAGQDGPESMRGRIVAKSGTVDESDNKGPHAKQGGYHFSDEDQGKLLMCPDPYVSKELKEHIIGHKFDDNLKPRYSGPNNEFYWKNKQREIKPEFIRDYILGHLGDKPVVGPDSETMDPENRFHKCMAAKVDEDLTEREFMKEIMFLDPKIGECIDTLDRDNCDQGFSDTFISLPAALRRTKTKPGSMPETKTDPLSFKDQDIVLDEMIHRSDEAERARCDETVSDTTKALQEKRRYDIDIQFPDMSSLWFIRDGDSFMDSLPRIINFLVIIAAIYLIGTLVLKLLSRGSGSKSN